MEVSHFGEMSAVSFPRDGHGRPAGYAMIEYGNATQAAAAIYGLHGWEVGNRDLEVTLLDREVMVPRNRTRGGPRASPHIWETDD